MANTVDLTSRMGAAWVQPGGPNTEPFFAGCVTVGDVTDPKTGIGSQIFCINQTGDGFDVVGQTLSQPGLATTSIESGIHALRGYFEKLTCPFTLYIQLRTCGRADVFDNYVRGLIMKQARVSSRGWSNFVHKSDDNPAMQSFEIQAPSGIEEYAKIAAIRPATAEAAALNDIARQAPAACYSDCGATVAPCDILVAAADAVGGVTANVQRSVDGGTTWAATAADPFAIGRNISSVVCFPMSNTVNRILVSVLGAAAAVQGMTAYSDDNGATWVTTNVGGAAAGHGAPYGGALFALDNKHIWLASAGGYIYFSSNGGVTWAVQEAGTIHAAAYNAIHFVDNSNGVAVGAAGVVAYTRNGGVTWTRGGLVTGNPALWGVVILDANRVWIGGAAGTLAYSNDFALTWGYRTSPNIIATDVIRDIKSVNNYVLWIAVNTVAPVGSFLRSVDGGWSWEEWALPTNVGLNAIEVCNTNNLFGVGGIAAATAFIAKGFES
jgi:photosystem II stability/assembly factor-like uncharacterized protein